MIIEKADMYLAFHLLLKNFWHFKIKVYLHAIKSTFFSVVFNEA